MDASLKTSLWLQFGATIDMLENSLLACPDALWDTEEKFWYTAYHTLFYLDYYLSEEPDDFSPPSPFTLSEFNPEGEMPERVYSKTELLAYLSHNRKKCHHLIASFTDESAAKRFVNAYRDYSLPEMLLYNMRHVQHHTGQLNQLLRQGGTDAPRWVSQTTHTL
ncbi:hypothetical protein EMGBS15_14040 [Filimonas sp.]|nr:hypothetical protein EMGBS15_14040 [Filimonas sp.]